jgi:hypothetical protein
MIFNPIIILLIFVLIFLNIFIFKLPITRITKNKYISFIIRLVIVLVSIAVIYKLTSGFDVRKAYYFPNSSLSVEIKEPWCEVKLDPNTNNNTFVLDITGFTLSLGDSEQVCFTVSKNDLFKGNVIPISKLNMWHFCRPYSSGMGHITDGNVTINKISRNKITMLVELPKELDRFKEKITFKLNSKDISEENYRGLIRSMAKDEIGEGE